VRHDDVFYAAGRIRRVRTLERGVFISIYLCVSDRRYYIIIVKEKEKKTASAAVSWECVENEILVRFD